MILKVNEYTCVVLDLDDTIYFEYDYLKSAYKYISNVLENKSSNDLYLKMINIYKNKGDVFNYIISTYNNGLTLDYLLSLYRNHYPIITPNPGVIDFLNAVKKMGGVLGLLTDGRSVTQRNKLKALGIIDYFDEIVISEEFGSEKPSPRNYRFFMKKYRDFSFVYIGDNLMKDFIIPKRFGWLCVALQNSKYMIHQYSISDFTDKYLPHFFISSFKDIKVI